MRKVQSLLAQAFRHLQETLMKHISKIMRAVCKEHGITMNQGDKEMTKDKQEVYVWECIFYTEDENGGITYYEAPDSDWSTIAECVEVEDLLEIKPEAVLAYEKVRHGVSEGSTA